MFEGLMWSRTHGDRAEEATPGPAPAPVRPSIGLALGGGAGRGFAHIGVLRTLVANGLVPDVIVGTSIGAVVGGCYAAGKLDEFEEWSKGLTWRGVLGYLDVSFSGSGLINGGRLSRQLEESVGKTLIDELPLKYAAIATEVATGHEIWLTRGRLADAMRASYALPGIFPPVKLGGRWLVDGALVNPVPVSAARALGARLVIAVNLNADLFGRGTTIASHGSDASDEAIVQTIAEESGGLLRGIPERLLKRQFFGTPGRPGISTVMTDAFNVMQDRITRARLAGDPPDVMISPRLREVGWFDFHRAAEGIALGEQAAERALESIKESLTGLA